MICLQNYVKASLAPTNDHLQLSALVAFLRRWMISSPLSVALCTTSSNSYGMHSRAVSSGRLSRLSVGGCPAGVGADQRKSPFAGSASGTRTPPMATCFAADTGLRPECTHCGEPLTVTHVLLTCRRLSRMRLRHLGYLSPTVTLLTSVPPWRRLTLGSGRIDSV